MKNIYLSILSVSIFLTGCTAAQKTSNNPDANNNSNNSKTQAVDFDQNKMTQAAAKPAIFNLVAQTTGLTEVPGTMMLRKEANDINLNVEGEGIVHRDQRQNYDFESNLDAITDALKQIGFQANVTQPSNKKLFKHVVYTSGNVTCYGEWRNLTSTGTDELAFGCK